MTSARVFRMTLSPAPVAVRGVRQLAGRVVRDWGASEETTAAVELVVDELVTNALAHGRGQISLVAYEDARGIKARGIRVEVGHEGLWVAPQVVEKVAQTSERGRGLLLVDALTREWGTSHDARWVWALFGPNESVPAARRGRSRAKAQSGRRGTRAGGSSW